MQFITIGVFTALSALLALGSNANASTFAVVDTTPAASLAWSGENESYCHLTLPAIEGSCDEVDLKLMTALAAPEPPAIVLAGMALGGLICGRSFLQKRRKATKETT